MVIQLGHQILDGNSPKLFEGSDKIFRDFINIEDVIQANIKSCCSKKNGIYNVGTGISRSFQDVADVLQKELNTTLEIEYITNPYKTGYQFNTQADISESILHLDFNPSISLESGIRSYISEIKHHHKAEKL